MKKFLVISLIVIISLILFFYFYNTNIKSGSKGSEVNNTSIVRTSENKVLNNTSNNSIDSKSSVPQEIQISTFSTKIYTKESSRQNNLSITCSTLNGTIVKAGETFSFTDTIGPSTSSKGYQEADIFDKNGNKRKGYGGGNCQVSSTLYNAILNTPGLAIVERHEHSNKVPYIETGKDAAVAYGSVDLKFRNDNNFDIKITCSTDKDNVYITLYKIQ